MSGSGNFEHFIFCYQAPRSHEQTKILIRGATLIASDLSRILIGSYLWRIVLYYIKQIDSMLSCVVQKTSTCVENIPDIFSCHLDRCTATRNLFVNL